MIVTKSLKIPVHYGITKSKLDKLNKLTARITFGIRLISSFITEDTKLDRVTIRHIVKDNGITQKTGLSAGFVDQIVDKVIWSWRSYKRLHNDWERRVESAKYRVERAEDDKDKEKANKSLAKLIKREPSIPTFQNKTPCRIDYRTGTIQKSSKSNSVPLWMRISTLEKGKRICIPLNPSHYHKKQLEQAKIDDFEICKHNNSGKYYAHITISFEIDEKKTSSVGGIDQGLNRTIATVLLNGSKPYEELLCDTDKRDLLDKYDTILTSLQQAKNGRKLKQLRNKRQNVAIYHDWCLANHVAEYTKGYYLAIGNASFHQTNIRGNGNPTLRKRVGKWSYGRQRVCIVLKRAEMGYNSMLIDEKYTSKTCHQCGSKLVVRKWLDESSYILCHSCGLKYDADLNAAHNIALRCRDDWLKVQMNSTESGVSA